MSIARGLNDAELAIAEALFATIKPDLIFQIDALCLRKFNDTYGQYDIAACFALRGNCDPGDDYAVQQKLF